MSNVMCASFFFFVLFIMLIPIVAIAAREIPDNNLAYPVQIKLTNCFDNQDKEGSGFFLNTPIAVYLVTARHVLFAPSSPKVKPNQLLICKQAILLSHDSDPKDRARNRSHLDLEVLNAKGHIKWHQDYDVAIVQIANATQDTFPRSVTLSRGVTPTEQSSSGILGIKVEDVKKIHEVLTANEIYVFAYSTNIGTVRIPQIDYEEPLIRKGIVAGINKQLKTIILDCLVFAGNSGGPVLEVERKDIGTTKFSIIGVISQYIPIEEIWQNRALNFSNLQLYNSGYSVAVPMDMVLELINESPAPQ